MDIFRWMHLSDFHFGKDGYDEPALCGKIVEYLRNLKEDGKPVDAIFVTGDIADKGMVGQYSDFEDLLMGVDDLYAGDQKPLVYIVPGNHDVDRNKNPMVQSGLYRYHKDKASEMLLDPTAKGKELRESIFPRFGGFSRAFQDSLCFPVDGLFLDKGFFADSIERDGKSIGIAGVNTAWLAYGKDDENNLTPGCRIVEQAMNALEGRDYKFLLGHHPLSWFRSDEEQRIGSLLAKHNAIYLFGHLHTSEAGLRIGMSGKGYLQFGAGAAFLTRDSDYLRHSIQYGELDEEGVKLHPVKWADKQQVWALDSPDYFPENNRAKGKDYWRFPFPKGAPGAGGQALRAKRAKKAPTLGREWTVIDKFFVEERERTEPSDQDMLMYFDGKSPEYSFVFSSAIPVRKRTEECANEFLLSQENGKSKCLLITGAGGEGKSTLALQVIHKLVKRNWVILHCADPERSTAITLGDLEAYESPVLLVVDNASVVAKELRRFLGAAKQAGRIVHLLLVSVLMDWLHVKGAELQWNDVSDYSTRELNGLERGEETDFVKAWGRYENGLGSLSRYTVHEAAERLYKETTDAAVKHQMDGALLGAIIRTRYRQEYYKEHVRSIVRRLGSIPLNICNEYDHTLLDAFLRIAAMHREEIFILCSDVLAELYGCDESEVKRDVIYRLGKEAVAGKSGDVIYIRHTALADCALQIAENELGMDVEDCFPQMATAAIKLKRKGRYVYKLGKWQYLADHFLDKGRKRLAVQIAEAVYHVNTASIQVLSHLISVYFAEPDPAFEIIYELLSSQKEVLFDNSLLNSFSISAWKMERVELSQYLRLLGLSDSATVLKRQPDPTILADRVLRTSNSFHVLSQMYDDEAFVDAGFAFARIGVELDQRSEYRQKLQPGFVQRLDSCGVDRDSLRQQISDGVNAFLKRIRPDDFPDSVPRVDKLAFERLLKRI